MPSYAPLEVDTVAQLKLIPPADGTVILCVGYQTIGDGRGGFFRYDMSSTAAEDLNYLNVITSSVMSTGRWVRVFQRVTVLPAGVLVNYGGVKTAYLQGTTDGNGRLTVNSTLDGTATGTAIFGEVWQASGYAPNAGGVLANDAVTASQVSMTADLKTVTFQFSRGNTTTLGATLTAVLGTVMTGLKAAPSMAATIILTGV